MKGQNWLWPNVREIFFNDLRDLHKRSGPWDFVLFSGDLAYSGNKQEFQEVDDLLDQLWAQCADLGSKPTLLAVPGNHDLARPRKLAATARTLKRWNEDPDAVAEFWDDPESEYREFVNGIFAEYTAWWDRQARRPDNMHAGTLPGEFTVSIEKEGARLGILGINTAFLQFDAGNYEKKLAFDPRQFQLACPDDDGPEWAAQHHACLVLSHHPRTWLNEESCSNWTGELMAHGRFALHLCGHMHQTGYEVVSFDGTESRRTWQGRSLFGLEHFADRKDRSHGYSVGMIELREQEGMLKFWPREAKKVGGQWELIPEGLAAREADQATGPTRFRLLKGYEAMAQPSETIQPPEPQLRPEPAAPDTRGVVIPSIEPVRALCRSVLPGRGQDGPGLACISLFTESPTRGTGRNLAKVTLFSRTSAELVQVVDQPRPWEPVANARSRIEHAMRQALKEGLGYPIEAGVAMQNASAWSEGLLELIQSNPAMLKLVISPAANSLTPELLLVAGDSARPRWLDTLFPIYRTLYHVDKRQVGRAQPGSLAILHQDAQAFLELAGAIHQDLARLGLQVDVYPGSSLTVRGDERATILQKIFQHRAVLFLGNLSSPGDGPGGWQLTATDWLSIDELQAVLHPEPRRRAGSAGWHPSWEVSVPEVVFATCYAGARADRTADGKQSFYPEMLLDGGVLFFVGTWMDVALGPEQIDTELRVTHKLITEFFMHWADEPGQVIKHLYEAKKACGFDLLTSLYQVYCAADQGAELTSPRPYSALVGGLFPGDHLGDYELVEKMWEDPYARTFWARDAASGSSYLVQVLIDEWQHSQALISALDPAVQKLQEAALDATHLIPDRHEILTWRRGDQELGQLHALVYNRPPDEAPHDWSTLAARPFVREDSDHFMNVLQLGAQLGGLLAELHEKKILHGNVNPGNIVFLKAGDEELITLKDAWVRTIRPGYGTDLRYAAPEDPAETEGVARFKYDCWSLGATLFELSTGQLPFVGAELAAPSRVASIRGTLDPSREHHVPSALERIVRECLMPAAEFRPAANLLARRLDLSVVAGGTYISELEQALENHIQAGHRLFAVRVDDVRDLETILVGLSRRSSGQPRYRVYEAIEDVGIKDLRSDQALQIEGGRSWWSADQILAQLPPQAARIPPSADEVADWNGSLILDWTSRLPVPPKDEIPILLIRGSRWWNSGMAQNPLTTRRLIKVCCYQRRFPVILIADDVLWLDEELERAAVFLFFPPPPPSELFEQILGAPSQEHLPLSEVPAEMAIDLAHQLYPSSRRAVSYALRMCALQYGVIDDRVVDFRDEEMVRAFRQLNTVTCTPFQHLPDPRYVGLSPALEEAVSAWAATIMSGEVSPRRLLIMGDPECGKTRLAESLARRIRQPLVRLDASRCLRGGLGESESILRAALAVTNSLAGAVVLLDDVDRFFAGPDVQSSTSAVAATMSRMSGILLNWLDTMPPGFVAVLTSSRPEQLSAQWRRRVELMWHLKVPRLEYAFDSGEVENDSLAYRANVFGALFAKCGLGRLAAEADFLKDLARESDPFRGPLFSPLARVYPDTELGRHKISLVTGADIERWIVDTITFNGCDPDRLDSMQFWREAMVGD
ncbi:MAG: AAA family ATPase [Anaerolineae bacterium]|nr:AAA family ATPase [Anaerolineae bacterium]